MLLYITLQDNPTICLLFSIIYFKLYHDIWRYYESSFKTLFKETKFLPFWEAFQQRVSCLPRSSVDWRFRFLGRESHRHAWLNKFVIHPWQMVPSVILIEGGPDFSDCNGFLHASVVPVVVGHQYREFEVCLFVGTACQMCEGLTLMVD